MARKTTKSAPKSAPKPKYDAVAAQAHRDTGNLAWRAIRVRGMAYPDAATFLAAVEAGTIVLDRAQITAEVEAYIAAIHCHESCKDHVREYGDAPYLYTSGPRLDADHCEVCSRPMVCVNGPEHKYHEMSGTECQASGIFHGGNCYHVSISTDCGHIEAIDSSG